MFPTFADAESYLNSLVNYEHTFPLGGARDQPKLQPTLDAVERIGLSRSLPRCLHIAGTVGKGSVAGFLEAILSTRYSTLCFTSPHLISVKERIRFNGKEIDDKLWCEGLFEITAAIAEPPQIRLTYFESTWVLFLWLARHLSTECHVVEAGLGGSWDATNVMQDTTAILTRIDKDHTKVLGETLREITLDKSGIIKPHSQVVSAAQQEESLNVLLAKCQQTGAVLHVFSDDFRLTKAEDSLQYRDADRAIEAVRIAAPGEFQRENAAIAIRAATLIDPQFDALSVNSALMSFVPTARQQLFGGVPPVIVDTAHNPASFEALASTLRTRFENRRISAVIGMMKDKDARSSLRQLVGIVDEVTIVSTGNPRSFAVAELNAICNELGLTARPSTRNVEAYEDLHGRQGIDLGLVTGSFYVAGDYLKWRRDAGIA